MKKIVISIVLLLSSVAYAESPQICNRDTVGVTACMANKLCECKFSRGGSMTGLPDDFRWDCGIMRPNCATTAQEPKPYDGPDSVTIDNSTVRQENSK